MEEDQTFGESFQGLGIAIIDSVGNLVGSFGTNAAANAANNTAIAALNNSNAQMALLKFQADQENKKKVQDMMQKALFALIGVITVIVLTNVGLKLYKTLN